MILQNSLPLLTSGPSLLEFSHPVSLPSCISRGPGGLYDCPSVPITVTQLFWTIPETHRLLFLTNITGLSLALPARVACGHLPLGRVRTLQLLLCLLSWGVEKQANITPACHPGLSPKNPTTGKAAFQVESRAWKYGCFLRSSVSARDYRLKCR